MFKNQKGITLIALVITIIVLLILAGVTIAMLTGTDSAPVKANEAKQKQDIGAAKDQVMINAQEYQTMAYDMIYVKGLPISGVASSGSTQSIGATAKSADIGKLVGKAVSGTAFPTAAGTSHAGYNLNSKPVGLATITTGYISDAGSTTLETVTGQTTKVTNGTGNDQDKATAWIKITTTDYKTYGYINLQGGSLVWCDAGIIGINE